MNPNHKIGEETAEVVIAFKGDRADAIVGEVADLLYHIAVAITVRTLDVRYPPSHPVDTHIGQVACGCDF
ncbi:phosphoribosyl-ATP diphosphatase [Nostoc sp.]|uniref:phosphoribosyl-ATP diphosphatase n=1 Tax=Nostoc sp. TaxID=1180 RepID=UPI003FA5C940